MTGDLGRLANPAPSRTLDSWEFVDAIQLAMSNYQ
jgi:hypothetical protein